MEMYSEPRRNHQSSSHRKKVIKIKVIPANKEKKMTMMYEKIQSNEEDVKTRTEREMKMTTDLLAEAGIVEPKTLGIKTGTLLKLYLFICTVTLLAFKLF